MHLSKGASLGSTQQSRVHRCSKSAHPPSPRESESTSVSAGAGLVLMRAATDASIGCRLAGAASVATLRNRSALSPPCRIDCQTPGRRVRLLAVAETGCAASAATFSICSNKTKKKLSPPCSMRLQVGSQFSAARAAATTSDATSYGKYKPPECHRMMCTHPIGSVPSGLGKDSVLQLTVMQQGIKPGYHQSENTVEKFD